MINRKLLLSSRKDSTPCFGVPIVYDNGSNWSYSIQTHSDGEQIAEITSYIGNSNTVTIPDSIDGYTTWYNSTNPIFNSTNGRNVLQCYIGCKIKHRLTTMSNMFYESGRLKTVNKNIVGPRVTNMYQTFMYCRELVTGPTTIPNSVTNMQSTFYLCRNLVNAPTTIPNSVVDMRETFMHCYNLVNAPTSIGDSVDDMYQTFYECRNVTEFPVTIPNSVTNMAMTFQKCINLVNGTTSIGDSVTNMYMTFYDCPSLKYAPYLGNSVTNMQRAFYGCTNLVNAPVIPNSVVDMRNTFSNCSNLVTAPVIGQSVVDMRDTFSDCTNLTGDIYIYSNNLSQIKGCFSNTYSPKNIYVYPNTKTYNTISKDYGNGENGVTIDFIK